MIKTMSYFKLVADRPLPRSGLAGRASLLQARRGGLRLHGWRGTCEGRMREVAPVFGASGVDLEPSSVGGSPRGDERTP